MEGHASDAPVAPEPDPLVSVTQLEKSLHISENLLTDFEAINDEILLLEKDELLEKCYETFGIFQTDYIKVDAEATELLQYYQKKLSRETSSTARVESPESVTLEHESLTMQSLPQLQTRISLLQHHLYQVPPL